MQEYRPDVRARARRAVQREIAEAANALFVERGYEATTVADIAAAIGMSQRSVFRYFASKEEIVLGKVDLLGDDMRDAIRARPDDDEPLWTALQRVIGVVMERSEQPGHGELIEPIHRLIFETPDLLAGYLQRLQRIQEVVVTELLTRAAESGTPYATDDPAPRALTAAAFGCLVAAQHSWLAAGARGSFADAVDRAMATVGPRR